MELLYRVFGIQPTTIDEFAEVSKKTGYKTIDVSVIKSTINEDSIKVVAKNKQYEVKVFESKRMYIPFNSRDWDTDDYLALKIALETEQKLKTKDFTVNSDNHIQEKEYLEKRWFHLGLTTLLYEKDYLIGVDGKVDNTVACQHTQTDIFKPGKGSNKPQQIGRIEFHADVEDRYDYKNIGRVMFHVHSRNDMKSVRDLAKEAEDKFGINSTVLLSR